MGFTHKGKRLVDNHDDFNDRIDLSDHDEQDPDKGNMNEEMVNRLNFGGGEDGDSKKKTRKEVFQEIIAKSKTFDQARKEMVMVTKELNDELDGEYAEL